MSLWFATLLWLVGLAAALPWSCPTVSPSTGPVDAHHLRASDIRVIAAMGDSMTAGFGMFDRVFVDGFFEYRGDQFSIGGNKDSITLPNLFTMVNGGRRLVGPSVGKSLPLDAVHIAKKILRPFDPKVDQLNAGQTAARIDALPAQLDFIIKQMRLLPGMDYENDWKLMTIFIGANDLCDVCIHPDAHAPQAFESLYGSILERIRTQIPRTFVNLIPLFNISQTYRFGDVDKSCRVVRFILNECDCLFGSKASDGTRGYTDVISREYNRVMYDLAARYENLPDFRVVVQPFTEDQVISQKSYLSKLDCFHPSLEANRFFAVAYWNSLFTPSSRKPHTTLEGVAPLCPDENTFLQ